MVEYLYSVFISTYGILFMGTSHNWMNRLGWHLLVANTTKVIDIDCELLAAIAKNSETLQNIADHFAPPTKQFRIYFFWEGLRTQWGSDLAYMVQEDSAAPT